MRQRYVGRQRQVHPAARRDDRDVAERRQRHVRPRLPALPGGGRGRYGLHRLHRLVGEGGHDHSNDWLAKSDMANI
ncbi:hypothetical protein GCM10020001_060050 [Nonomuraea salmonea]